MAKKSHNDPEYKKWEVASRKTHKVWHKFEAFLIKNFGEDYYKNLSGYECMNLIEAYVRENKEITIIGCDDSYHASAFLVIVPHLNMGNTVLFIPQCTTIGNQFFLYPQHQENLVAALTKMTHKDG